MGRPPKPTNLKILQGNPGKRPLNMNEPKFQEVDAAKMPPYLNKFAKKEWKRIAPLLKKVKLLTEADITALAAYCQAYHRWLEAEKLLRIHGYTEETDKGNTIQRPEVTIANKAMELMLKFGKEFGLTPSSRSSLHVEQEEKTDDPFMKFVKGNG